MLEKEKALDYRTHPTGQYKQYLYKCRTCEADIWVRSNKLQIHTGWCFDCALADRTLRPFESTYNTVLRRTAESDYPGEVITYERFLEFTKIDKCEYCNETIDWRSKRSRDEQRRQTSKVNLDRLDSSLGYSEGNLVVCCGRCNYFKSSWVSYEAMKEIGPILSKYNTGSWYRGGHTGPVKT